MSIMSLNTRSLFDSWYSKYGSESVSAKKLVEVFVSENFFTDKQLSNLDSSDAEFLSYHQIQCTAYNLYQLRRKNTYFGKYVMSYDPSDKKYSLRRISSIDDSVCRGFTAKAEQWLHTIKESSQDVQYRYLDLILRKGEAGFEYSTDQGSTWTAYSRNLQGLTSKQKLWVNTTVLLSEDCSGLEVAAKMDGFVSKYTREVYS